MRLADDPRQHLQGGLFVARAGERRHAERIRAEAQGVLDGVELRARPVHRPQHGAGAVNPQHQPDIGQQLLEATGRAVARHHRVHTAGDHAAQGVAQPLDTAVGAGNHAVVARHDQRAAIGLEDAPESAVVHGVSWLVDW